MIFASASAGREPVLGGVLVAAAGWRWVFLFNVPLAVLLALAVARAVPCSQPGTVRVLDPFVAMGRLLGRPQLTLIHLAALLVCADLRTAPARRRR